MKIGIYAIGRKPNSSGGSDEYLKNLIRGLATDKRGNEFVVFVSDRKLQYILAEVENNNIRFIYFSPLYLLTIRVVKRLRSQPLILLKLLGNLVFRKTFGKSPFAVPTQGLYEKYLNLEKYGLDCLHFPSSNIDPSFLGSDMPLALTIFDLQHEYYPDFFDKQELRVRRERYQRSAYRADVVVTISEFTKACLQEKYEIRAENIIVTHLGCGEAFEARTVPSDLEEVRRKYQLPPRFAVYPAATWPHKNHMRLLEAVSLIREKWGVSIYLVLCGLRMEHHDKVREVIVKLNLSTQVKLLGFVSVNELQALYKMATIMVFPSLFEGFGIPLLEAMNMGLPIACSDRTSIPEVAGDAAIYFDPENTEDMANKILSLMDDEDMRNNLSDKGLLHARKFSWKNAASATIMAYEYAITMAMRQTG